MADNNTEGPRPGFSVTSGIYPTLSAREQNVVQILENMRVHDGYIEFVTDTRGGGTKNHNFTGDAIIIRFGADALPVPPKIRSGYWERVYNRADSAKKGRSNRTADQKNRKTYREALLKLAEDLCSAGEDIKGFYKAEKRRVLRETRGVLDDEFVVFMAREGIEIDLTAWNYKDQRDGA